MTSSGPISLFYCFFAACSSRPWLACVFLPIMAPESHGPLSEPSSDDYSQLPLCCRPKQKHIASKTHAFCTGLPESPLSVWKSLKWKKKKTLEVKLHPIFQRLNSAKPNARSGLVWSKLRDCPTQMFVRWFVPLTIPVDLCWGQAGGCTLPVTTYFVEGTASHGNWFVGLPQHIREFRHAPRPRVLVCGFETKSFVGTIRCRCVGVSSVGSQNRYARLIRVLIRSSFGATNNNRCLSLFPHFEITANVWTMMYSTLLAVMPKGRWVHVRWHGLVRDSRRRTRQCQRKLLTNRGRGNAEKIHANVKRKGQRMGWKSCTQI